MFDWIDQMRQTWRYRKMPKTPDLIDTALRLAAEESAAYQTQHMRTTPVYPYDLALHRAMLKQAPPGHIIEFGVATGRTIKNMARHTKQTIHGFDSWQGLPESWTWLFPRGAFAGSMPKVPKNVELHPGYFSNTLNSWLAANPGTIALAHIDVDLYSSARYVLDRIIPKMIPGSIIIFDEYMNYPGWQQDEFRAWQEVVSEHNITYQYIGRVTSHQQVAVKILAQE